MSRRTKLAALAVASASAVALTAFPNSAWAGTPFTAGPPAGSTTNLVINPGGISCTSTLAGTMNGGGSFSVTSATATGCGVTVTPTGLPWSGNFTPDPATGATSGTVTMYFSMKALGCTYSGTLSGTYTNPPLVVTFPTQPVTGSGLFCVSGATVSATYAF